MVKRTLERGKSGIVRVATIVDGLLRFARAGARPDAGVVTQIRAAACSRSSSDSQPVAEAAGVTLTLEEPPASSVWGHPGVLASVVENLTRNAIKYIGERPRKTVNVRVVPCAATGCASRSRTRGPASRRRCCPTSSIRTCAA